MPHKKKILFIITYLELGGAQKQLLYIFQTLDKNKYEIYLYAGNRGYLRSDFLSLSGINVKLDFFLVREINPFFDIVAFFKLVFFIKKHKFDIVHTHSPKASILGRWAAYLGNSKNIIYTVHGWPFHKFMNPFTYYLYFFLEKITAKITKTIVVVSNADLENGIKNKLALPNKFFLVHYGIEVDKFKNIWIENDRDFSITSVDKKPIVLTVSSLKPQKGIMRFLEVAKMLLGDLPDLEFIIVGDGPLRRRIVKEIRKHNLDGKVFLYGWVRDISELLKKANLFLLTSLWEGLPVALIEVVAAGLPFVVTNTGGVLDIARFCGRGVVVDSFKPETVKNACLKILKAYQKCDRITITQREQFDVYYWSYRRMVNQLESIYESMYV